MTAASSQDSLDSVIRGIVYLIVWLVFAEILRRWSIQLDVTRGLASAAAATHPLGISPSWLDIATFLMVGGLTIAAAAWRARGQSLLPLGDPYIVPAIRYVEP